MTISALTIAGSDPSGGAGIQQDLKVFAALGVAGLSAITALTVQNSQGVRAVHPVAPDLLEAQIEAVLSDSEVRAVKIGMLGGAAQVHAVASCLRRFRPPNVVLDPVLASTTGAPLLSAAGISVMLDELLPLCDLVTPNLDELQVLADVRAEAPEAREVGKELRNRGARAILIKGGHLPGDPTDVLLAGDTTSLYLGERIETPHTHGTGCALSAAIAGYLALGEPLERAIDRAKRRLEHGLRNPVIAGKGRGYPNIHSPSPTGPEKGQGRRADLLPFGGLYVLTDGELRPNRSHEEIVEAALAGGARILQLREKRLPTPELIELAKRLAARVQRAGGLFFVNDRVDVALAVNADGVHLGPDDMRPADARRLMGPNKLIGVSVSTVQEARPLAQYASYLGVGAIFGSATKSDAGPAVGVERIREIRAAFPDHPIVGIGGIHTGNIADVAAAGADCAAVVSAVVAAPDMAAATAELIRRFAEGRAA